ncbi:pre-toxin TG domain-containing protein [Clostridium sp. D43t1_170807_H7]|uniref:pre-toxin TG domain-containing protein n=1 Tax=Clostridium sp. D43t1_170807_H7 TaxID=2787140 RepID=UPI001899B0CE
MDSFFEWVAPNDTVYNVTNSILDMAVSCIQVVGDIRDVVEVLTGVNMMTGEELSLLEKGVTLACMFLLIVGISFVRESRQD